MPEASLKELSDRATPGEWHIDLFPYFCCETGEPQPPICEGICTHDEDAGLADSIATCNERQAAFIVALVNAFRAGQLHDATALAEAKAQATRDAFEEAARLLWRKSNVAWAEDPHSQTARVMAYCADFVWNRALATAPAETEKPETGESKTHWALRLAMQYLDRCAAEDQGFHEDGPKPEADACSVCTEIAAVLGIDIESPEYDALVAYPPQPTATNTLEDGHA